MDRRRQVICPVFRGSIVFRAFISIVCFNPFVWKKFVSHFRAGERTATGSLRLVGRKVPLLMVRHPRARRYVLRLLPDGTARVTVPRGGNPVSAREFVERNRPWLETQLEKTVKSPAPPPEWKIGT